MRKKTELKIEELKERNLPTVSIIIPMRNEEKFIEGCIGSILKCDYPRELIEIIVVDGRSDDVSRELVSNMAKKYGNILLLDNEKKIVPTAMNIGIRKAKGDFIIRMDSHSEYAPDYVSKCVEYSKMTGADNVGGPMQAIGKTLIQKAVALATSCPFGVGNSKGHFEDIEGYYKAVYLGAYKRGVFQKIGLYDEELIRNQDEELNWRLIKNGSKIYITPNIKSYYYPRSSLRKLWKQYYEYGFWKVRLLQKHLRMMEIRHFIPATFIITFMTGFILSFFNSMFFYLLVMISMIYLIFNLFSSLKIAKKEGWKYLMILPLVFTTLHFSYGVGFLLGLVKFLPKWFIEEPKAPQVETH